MRSTIKTYLITIIGVSSGIATLIGFQLKLVPKLISETQLAVLFIGFFSLYFFIAHVATRAKWERKIRYAESLNYLNLGFEEIHFLNRCEEDINKEQVILSFETLCTFLASVYSLLTNTQCSACIKILKSSSKYRVTFETLCRDKSIRRERRIADNKSKELRIAHTLQDNTAFSTAAHSEKGFFLSNKLPLLGGYKNTSFELYDEKPYLGLNPFFRIKHWPLPYKSTIVVPITPLKFTKNKSDIIGFLCVDSPKLGVFRKEYDVDILHGVADGIYNTLIRFKNLLSKK